MSRRRIFFLYEHGEELHPWSSGHIRMLRPFSHPSVAGEVEVVPGRDFDGGRYDAVVVERLWRPRVTLEQVERLLGKIRRARVPLLYTIDDNLLDHQLGMENEKWFGERHVRIVELLAREARGVMVSTEPLRRRMAHLNPNLLVVPNALDERLLARVVPTEWDTPFPRRRKIIGYMGTTNHDEDLQMIADALRAVCARRSDVAIQMLGVVQRPETLEVLRGLPVRVDRLPRAEWDYPLFMLWYTSRLAWDIGLAPLRVNPYTACKSDIKVLDYAAIGAVGIYSPLPPYDYLRDGKLGLVTATNDAAEWTRAIETLLDDQPRRLAMRDAAREYLFRERTLAQRARSWPEALDRLLQAAA